MTQDPIYPINQTQIIDSLIQQKIDSLILYDSTVTDFPLRIFNITQQSDAKLFEVIGYDTVFTVVITISIFVLGIIIDRYLKYLDQIKEQKNTRIYFKTYIDKISNDTAPRLSNLYKEFYQEININIGIPSTPPKILTGDFNRINNIDSKALFNSIKEKEFLSKALSSIDFIDKIISEVSNYHIQALKDSDFYRAPMQDLLDSYTMSLADFLEFLRKNKLAEQYSNFRNLLNDSILHYHQNIVPNNDIKKLYKEIIRPIQDYIVENQLFREEEIEERINTIMIQGKDLSYKFNYLRRVTIDIRITYREFARLLEESSTKLNSYKNQIKW